VGQHARARAARVQIYRRDVEAKELQHKKMFDSGHPDVLSVLQRQVKVRQTHQYLLNMLRYMFRPL
jgi:hypothetical protein